MRETFGELTGCATAELEAVSDTPRLDVELLLAEVTGSNRASIMAHPERVLTPAQFKAFSAMLARRRSGEPLAYIVGRKEFYSLMFAVRPGVLVPRPETELLVEWVLSQQPPEKARVLDLGTGSGAIALALKQQRPDLTVTAVDCSEQALVVARQNAAELKLDIAFVESDWFSELADESFELIVSNPPYVRSSDAHLDDVGRHEPRLALDGGDDGLDAYRRILGEAGRHLAIDGRIAFEHGFDQRAELIGLAGSFGFVELASLDDLAGQHRAVAFRKRDDD